jgi:hypothetical protein
MIIQQKIVKKQDNNFDGKYFYYNNQVNSKESKVILIKNVNRGLFLNSN